MNVKQQLHRFRRIGEMIWPDPAQLNELAWTATHHPEGLTDQDHLVLAAVVTAYQSLITKGRAEREMICKQLRKKD